MTDLIHAAFSPVNLIYSILLILVLLYWFSVIIGAMDIGSVDVDFDMDADIDVDVEVDVDADMDTEVEGGGVGWLAGVLHFFNFGKMPFMIIMSFIILFAWTINILTNHYFGGGAMGFALAMLFPNLFVSLVVTKIITTPFIPIFKNLNTAAEEVNYIGMRCTMTLPADHLKMGQAEVMLENTPLLVNVKVAESDKGAIAKGEQAVIVDQGKDESYFIIKKV